APPPKVKPPVFLHPEIDQQYAEKQVEFETIYSQLCQLVSLPPDNTVQRESMTHELEKMFASDPLLLGYTKKYLDDKTTLDQNIPENFYQICKEFLEIE